MLSQLGQNFDPLGLGTAFFLKAKLAIEKFAWDDEAPESVVKEWEAWPYLLEM